MSGSGRSRKRCDAGAPAQPGAWGRACATLWDGKPRGFLFSVFRAVAEALWKFDGDRGFLRASALTYLSLLSLVPLLAITFSVLKGMGVQRRLESLVLERFAAGNAEVVSRILEYVDRTQVASLGAAGLAGLLFTLVIVLGNVELSFNDIWQIRRGRSLARQISDYVALMFITPVLLLASLSLTTTLHSPGFLRAMEVFGPALHLFLRSLPFLATVLALTAVYLILPNRRIPVSSALVGGAVAGGLWHLAEWAYVKFQFGLASYNAIYGTMAQLPVLLVWVYTSWCIVLLGAELACVHELHGQGVMLRRSEDLWIPLPVVALRALVFVAGPFEEGCPGPKRSDLLVRLGQEPRDGNRLIDWLVDAGLVALTRDEPARLVPAVSPDRVSVAELLERLTGLESHSEADAEPLELNLRKALTGQAGDATWADLAREKGE